MELELSASDAAFEDDLSRSPFLVKTWCAYAESKPAGAPRLPVYERAVERLPGSFKLWAAYLNEALKVVRALATPLQTLPPRPR